jgi:predicted RNA-binding Zn-ribbon protein involved in translation (DUF1610 family)
MNTPVPHWEKSGNATWAACRSCRGWFPVAAELVEQNTVQLVCPHCGDQFSASEAADTRKP